MSAAEVKPGYKVTEVGVIPEDWEVRRLSDIAMISSGGTPDRKNRLYWDGHIPWVTTSQIDFGVIEHAIEFITQKGLESSAARVYPSGTLLMAMYGQGKTRGKIAILGIPAAVNQACAAIGIREETLGEFVFYNLTHRYDEIRGLSNLGNQENLNSGIISSILVPLPPLPEQRA
ncbi:MAG TPA: restriction endonuclease subunit S, partial [Chloroflexi bacterium]|nr:restriction endonuclease subunit S [Chloroflexota bacterium]